MLVPLSWLKDYVDINVTIDDLAYRLTMSGLAVEKIERLGADWERDKIFVGRIVRIDQHPNADRLVVATVDYGAAEPQTVVTGAPNLKVGDTGQKVPFAVVGARVIDGHKDDGSSLVIKPAKLRGVQSAGMVLSEKELGLSDSHEGIIILPPDAPVGVPLADYLGDTVLDIELTPNLTRASNIVGTAREWAAIAGQRVRYPTTAMVAEGEPIAGKAHIVIEDPDLCSRYSATIIEGVEIRPSPQWLGRRLTLAGMRPISNIVDVTNYVMLEMGQPLHAFDYDKLVARAGGQAPTIIVRRARPGEEMRTLDGAQRKLTADMLLICDTAGPVAIAGVMGGEETEVSAETTRILLEAANFNNLNTRRTAALLKLQSEASARFGRGIHPALTVPAAQRATELMRELGGGTIAQGVLDEYPVPAETVVAELATRDVQRILGMDIPAGRVVEILKALEFEVEIAEQHGDDWRIRAVVPPHRLDVSHSYDLLEEVARIEGYDRIPATLLSDELPPQRPSGDIDSEERVRDLLAGAGLQEVMTYAMTSPEREAALHPGLSAAAVGERPYLVVANPIRPDRAVMRHTLLASALETLANNARYRERIAIFEVAPVYLPLPGEALPQEPRRLVIALAGPRQPATWSGGSAEPFDFYDLKGVIDMLLGRMGLQGEWAPLSDHPTFHPGRAARVSLVGGPPLGPAGELHPLVRDAFNAQSGADLPSAPILLAELDLDAILARATMDVVHTPILNRPPAKIDLAVVVDEAVPQARVFEAIGAAGGELLRDVQLFDLYRGPQIGLGKKSLAYALVFQAADRTLTDAEVAALTQRIVDRLSRDLGATLRT
ncbi:MAG: phenylalanine--tRNA ligase subunit beta [Anaerolineae bacterium]